MRPVCYIDESFLDAMDRYEEDDSLSRMDKQSLRVQHWFLLGTLLALELKVKISSKLLRKYHSEASNQEALEFPDKRYIIKMAIKENRLSLPNHKDETIANSINFSNIEETQKYDLANIGFDPSINNQFYNYRKEIKVSPSQIEIFNIKHQLNSILIVDPYIFQDDSRYEPKTPNLINFIKTFFTEDSVHYYLSIMSFNRNNDNHNNLIQAKIREIKDFFPHNNLTVSVFYPRHNLLLGDRHIYTNYFSMQCGHLFDRPTIVSNNCLFSSSQQEISSQIDEIRNNYKECNKVLGEIRTLYQNEPENLGLVKIKFGNILDNKIFH